MNDATFGNAAVQVTARATMVLANNPGMMTLDGTNTWILREPGSQGVVVLDPGPLDEPHLAAVLELARQDGGRVELVIYSHWHADHTESIDRFAELSGAPSRALDAKWCRGANVLSDGETIETSGLTIKVLATPGHTSDSLCLLLPDEGSLLSADTILGRGTTVVAHPDGALGSYLDSLHLIRELVEAGVVQRILPGHGPVIDEPLTVVDGYLQHREDRLRQVQAAVEAGDATAREVVERVYTDVDPELWWAAEMSVRAQLDYLGV